MNKPDRPVTGKTSVELSPARPRRGTRFGFPVVVCFGLPAAALHVLLGALSQVPARWIVCGIDPRELNDVALHCPDWMDVRTCRVPAFDAAGAALAISAVRESAKAQRSCIWVGVVGTFTPNVPDLYYLQPVEAPAVPAEAVPYPSHGTQWIEAVSKAVAAWHVDHGHRPCGHQLTDDGPENGSAD